MQIISTLRPEDKFLLRLFARVRRAWRNFKEYVALKYYVFILKETKKRMNDSEYFRFRAYIMAETAADAQVDINIMKANDCCAEEIHLIEKRRDLYIHRANWYATKVIVDCDHDDV